jgi:DNA helicase-2/ATP-dependent DNA helicase PcrA
MIESVMEAVYDDYLLAKYPNYEQRREDLNTLANFSSSTTHRKRFLDQLALLTGMDTDVTQRNEENDRVVLTSVHQAKGLEWKVVFVIWLADGKFPSTRSMERGSDRGERRLFLRGRHAGEGRALPHVSLRELFARLRRSAPAAFAFPCGSAEELAGGVQVGGVF